MGSSFDPQNNVMTREKNLKEEIGKSYEAIRIKMGMNIEQNKIEEQIKIQKTSKPKTNLAFDRFHSPLRIINPNTCISSSYKSLLLGPVFETIGRIFCFANDEDCDAIAQPFGKKYSMGRTTIAYLKASASFIGVGFRLLGSGISYGLNLITGSIASVFKRKPDNVLSDLTGKPFRTIEPLVKLEVSKNTDVTALKVLTLNCGLLRDLFWDVGGRKVKDGKLPFNELRPPRERAEELAEKIIELDKNNPRDVVCLQEVFDNLAYFGLGKDAQQILIDKLKSHFPYIIYDVGQRTWPAVGSGLVLLSKTEILEAEYHRYPNLIGLDTTSNKGFLAAKIKKGDQFYTVYNTHTQAGRGGLPTQWLERLINWKAPIIEPGAVRGEQLGFIEEHRANWADKAPKDHESLKHMDTVLTGDINQQLNDADKIFTVSHHKHPEEKNRQKGKIKYQGQVDLLKNFHFTLPENFVDCKVHKPIYVLEINNEKMKVLIDTEPKPKENEITKDFIQKNKQYFRIQFAEPSGELNTRSLNENEIENGKIVLLRSGVDPLRIQQLQILIQHEKDRIFNELKPIYQGTDRDLHLAIHEKFEMLTGSIMSKSSLKHALSDQEAKPEAFDIAEPKEVDIATSQKAESTKVSLVTPRTPKKTLVFSEQKPLVTDHVAMMADFTYKNDNPKPH